MLPTEDRWGNAGRWVVENHGLSMMIGVLLIASGFAGADLLFGSGSARGAFAEFVLTCAEGAVTLALISIFKNSRR